MATQSECMQSDSSTECTICLLDYNDETKTKTECNHFFHQECLDKWLETNNSCPLCRTELKKDMLCHPIYVLPSELYRSRVEVVLGNRMGYNVEDFVFGREILEAEKIYRSYNSIL